MPNPGFPMVRDGDTLRAPNVRRSLYFGTPNENENNADILAGIAQLEQDLGDQWLATLRLNRSSIRLRNGAENYATGGSLIPGDGNTNLYSVQFNQDDDVWSGELRLNGSLEVLGRPANLTFGVDHTKLESGHVGKYASLFNPDDPDDRANIYEENFADFPTRPPNIYADFSDVQEDTGVYGQFQIRPFERLGVLLGGRYDRSDASFEDRLNSARSSEKQDEAYTGRVGLVFDVSQQVSVYGLYAQSFDSVLSVGAEGEILEPETGEIFEAGIKTEWLDGRLGVNAALFRLDRNDIPIAVVTAPGVPGFSVSGGLQRTDGIELEINGEPLPGWNLSFGGSLSDSEFKEGPFVGSIPLGAADWQVGLYTGYELQTGPLKGVGLGAGLFAIDERGPSPDLAGNPVLEGYERVDLSAFYNGLEGFNIALQVRNVFDERYIEGVSFNNAQFGSPTAVLLTVRIDLEGLGK